MRSRVQPGPMLIMIPYLVSPAAPLQPAAWASSAAWFCGARTTRTISTTTKERQQQQELSAKYDHNSIHVHARNSCRLLAKNKLIFTHAEAATLPWWNEKGFKNKEKKNSPTSRGWVHRYHPPTTPQLETVRRDSTRRTPNNGFAGTA